VDLLLDTHALLWWLFDSPKLSKKARSLIRDSLRRVLVSSASAWEISTKHRLGRLPEADLLVVDIPKWIRKAGFVELPVTVAHGQRAGSWPQAHQDPFDRMLAAQSDLEDLAIVSRDRALDDFGIRRIW
jgi:PIN domain nuclease of toxin-antitoxin system